MQKDGPYIGFQGVDFGVKSDISVEEDGLHFGEYVFKQSYFFFISVWHLTSGIILKLKNLKAPTCFILSPFAKNVT